MPISIKRCSLSEYEEASGLQRGELWKCLTLEEQNRLVELGYRSRSALPNGAFEYLKAVFPVPENFEDTKLISLTQYEKKCGFAKNQLRGLLTEEQYEHLKKLGYRVGYVLPYRVVLYLRSLGFY